MFAAALLRGASPIPGGRAELWRVSTAVGPAVLKRSRNTARFDAECSALRAVQGVVPGAPRLLDADRDEGWLLMSAVPGERVRRVNGQILYAAGASLRALHRLPVADDTPRGDALVRWATRIGDRTEGALPPSEVNAMVARVRELADAAGPSVRLHGDFCGRNWLWDGEHLGVVDWELSRVGCRLLDLSRLGQGLGDPELRRAFFNAYGDLTADEAELTDALCRMQMLSGLAQAVRAGRTELASAIRKML